MNSKLSKILLQLFMALAIGGYSQNTIFTMPPKYFKPSNNALLNLPTQASPGYMGQPSDFAHTAMQDANGNLKFFIVDNSIYDGQGYLIEEMIGNQNLYPIAELTVVPDPGNCNRYFIFGSTKSNMCAYAPELPYYCILNLALPSQYYSGKKGALELISGGFAAPIANMAPGFFSGYQLQGGCYFSATKIRPDNSRFVFITNGYGVFRFKLDAQGFRYDNYQIQFGYPALNQQAESRAEMELVELPNGNYRLAVPYLRVNATQNGPTVFLLELNPNGLQVANRLVIFSQNGSGGGQEPRIRGLEFSPDGNILYIVHRTTGTHPNPIQYYRWDNQSLNVLNGISNATDFQFSQIERGKNGKLYIPAANRFAIIGAPNTISGITSQNFPLSFNYPASYLRCPINPQSKAYTMADQIDGMDYQAHYLATPTCCMDNKHYSAVTYVATTSATWTPGSTTNPFGATIGNAVTIKNELRIPAGKTITIKNMQFEFAPGAKVVVERGAGNLGRGRLILDGTTFTSNTDCDTKAMWLGVEVQGYPNENQSTSLSNRQGRLEIINHSKIENAIRGVVACKMSAYGNYPFASVSYDYGYAGGVVIAKNSKFRNNIVDVYLPRYVAPNQNDNLSSFRLCTFETDGLLANPSFNPRYHVQLYAVKGIYFTGCEFANRTPNQYIVYNRGRGIQSVYSQFKAQGTCGFFQPCTNNIPCKFKNLQLGVYAYASNLYTAAIERSKFEDCHFGIQLEGIKYASMLQNEFKIPIEPQPTCGIFMSRCDGYRVEENSFRQGLSNSLLTYGVVVDNSGTRHNEIYKNSFYDLAIGIQAQGTNGSSFAYGDPNSSNQGLQFRCNFFDPDFKIADIAVASGKIDYQQGYCLPAGNPYATLSPAGNYFSGSTNNAENEFAANASVQAFNYAHHSNLPLIHYSTSTITTQQCLASIVLGPVNAMEGCPSKILEFSTGKSHLEIAEEYNLNLIQAKYGKNSAEVPDMDTQFYNGCIQFEIDEFIRKMLFDSTKSLTPTVWAQIPELRNFQTYLRLPEEVEVQPNEFASDPQSEERRMDSISNAFPPIIEPLEVNGTLAGNSIQIENTPLKIVPNPSSGEFELVGNSPCNGKAEFNLYDMNGRLIYSKNVSEFALPIKFSIPESIKGFFLLEIASADGSKQNLRVILR